MEAITTAPTSSSHRRNYRRRRSLLLSNLLFLSFTPSSICFHPVSNKLRYTSIQSFNRPKQPIITKFLEDAEDGGDDTHFVTKPPTFDFWNKIFPKRKSKEEQEKEQTTIWLSWLQSGRPLGTGELTMRDPVELGGVPRADRYSARDWWHNVLNMTNSTVLKDIKGPLLAISLWATFVSTLHRISPPLLAKRLVIPATCHSLMVSSLGLLLVFRTNSAYQRFAEGRKIWEGILSTSRDLSRMTKLYEIEIGAEKRRRVQRLLAAFPYLLRHRIRPSVVMRKLEDTKHERDPEFTLLLYQDYAAVDNDAEAAAVADTEETTGMSRRKPRELYWVDKRTLPWRLLPKGAMEKCARAQNRPLWVVDRMSKELATVPDGPNFTNRERLALLKMVDTLSHSIGKCERIHQTVVPLNYARHALRSLTFWLISLPFALVESLGLLTGPMVCIISWILFGVYEIGTRIEDPFQGTLRLSILCDGIRRDVLADELIRETAFQLDDVEQYRDTLNGLMEDDEDKEEDGEYIDILEQQEEKVELEEEEEEPLVMDLSHQNSVNHTTAATIVIPSLGNMSNTNATSLNGITDDAASNIVQVKP